MEDKKKKINVKPAKKADGTQVKKADGTQVKKVDGTQVKKSGSAMVNKANAAVVKKDGEPVNKRNKEALAKKVIETLENTLNGNVTKACKAAGIPLRTFYNWRKKDKKFADEVEAARSVAIEMTKDHNEDKLQELIDAGDTTATIFYLKTKARDRGYGLQSAESYRKAAQEDVRKEQALKEFKRKVANKKSYLIRLLKKQNKYSPELSMQVELTATLTIKAKILAEQIATDGSVTIEVSREGNERQSVSAKEKLFIAYTKQLQSALRGLGMNTDTKAQIGNDQDGLSDFLNALNDGK